jgi:hypothetical protein
VYKLTRQWSTNNNRHNMGSFCDRPSAGGFAYPESDWGLTLTLRACVCDYACSNQLTEAIGYIVKHTWRERERSRDGHNIVNLCRHPFTRCRIPYPIGEWLVIGHAAWPGRRGMRFAVQRRCKGESKARSLLCTFAVGLRLLSHVGLTLSLQTYLNHESPRTRTTWV